MFCNVRNRRVLLSMLEAAEAEKVSLLSLRFTRKRNRRVEQLDSLTDAIWELLAAQ